MNQQYDSYVLIKVILVLLNAVAKVFLTEKALQEFPKVLFDIM
jgi:hypothetical protein